MADSVTVSEATLRRQMAALLAAWGMPGDEAAASIEAMLYADLRGIDSHGVAMMPLYGEWLAAGKLGRGGAMRVVAETPATLVLDGGGGLGHAPGTKAMLAAIAKARAVGVAVATVRNSGHYGAAGHYARLAADAGLIGMSMTAAPSPAIVPTFGRHGMFGTNPIAFAVPAGRNPPFVLDMATSTVAIGKLHLAVLNAKPVPKGWAFDAEGRPTEDAEAAYAAKQLTPLGGSREQGSHKGYGLAAMVELLSTFLAGATWTVDYKGAGLFDIGHFFLALDPRFFRSEAEFRADVDHFVDTMRAMPRADADQPVLVAGDPEEAQRVARSKNGIPIPAMLLDKLKKTCADAGAEFVLAR